MITKDMVFEIFARYACYCIAVLDGGDTHVNSREGEFKIASKCVTITQSMPECLQFYSLSMFKDYKPLNNNNKEGPNHKDVCMFDFNFIIKVFATCD